MKICFLFILSFFALGGFSQTPDFSKVDEHALKTPSSKTKSVVELADYLTGEFSSDLEKVRAIYVWIAGNIKYDIAVVSSRNISSEQRKERQEPERVLKSKKAVCEGYSNLFYELCKAAGLKAGIATGYTKDPDGEFQSAGHAWNLVQVDGEWRLIDNTWGAGGVNEKRRKFVRNLQEEYFLGKPENFIQDHYPNDPLFQLLPYPVSLQDFKRNNLVQVQTTEPDGLGSFAHFSDSLTFYVSLDSVQKLLNGCYRMLRFDPETSFANFILGEWHFKKAMEHFDAYQNEAEALFRKNEPFKDDHLDRWELQIAKSATHLTLSTEYLSNARPGDQFSELSKSGLKSVREAESSLRMAKNQLDTWKRNVSKGRG